MNILVRNIELFHIISERKSVQPIIVKGHYKHSFTGLTFICFENMDANFVINVQ